MQVIYIGVLPKNGVKSQGYNSFTIAFFTMPEIMYYSYIWLYNSILLTEYFLSVGHKPLTSDPFDCYMVLIPLYCPILRVI